MRFNSRITVFILAASVASCDYNFIGPTINNVSTNTNTNDNKIDVHDVVNFAPVPNPSLPVPTPPGTIPPVEVPLPLPTNAEFIAQKVATDNPVALGRSCPETFGEIGWQFLDLVIRTLQSNDMRWGYLVKTDGTISKDVIAYRATSDNIGAWGVDIIIDRCGQSKFSWQVLGFDPATVWSAIRNGS